MKKIIIELLDDLDNKAISSRELVKRLRETVQPMDRVKYVRDNLYLCPLTNRVFSKRTKLEVGAGGTIHVGAGSSPVSTIRAKWYLLAGTDPAYVGDERGRVYAKMETGGPKIYADQAG